MTDWRGGVVTCGCGAEAPAPFMVGSSSACYGLVLLKAGFLEMGL